MVQNRVNQERLDQETIFIRVSPTQEDTQRVLLSSSLDKKIPKDGDKDKMQLDILIKFSCKVMPLVNCFSNQKKSHLNLLAAMFYNEYDACNIFPEIPRGSDMSYLITLTSD